ncbi:MAG: NTP transferase domain-containing protein [Ilumatobacteraceae bacterium]
MVEVDRTVVVVGHGAEQVTKKVQEQSPGWAGVSFVEQTDQRGTGHAVIVGLTAFPDDPSAELDDTSNIVVLPGDTPLLRKETIDDFLAFHESSGHAASLLTAEMADPSGYGRVVRGKDGRVMRIVEQRDASPRSWRSPRSTPASTRSGAICSGRRCAASAPRTPRRSTT